MASEFLPGPAFDPDELGDRLVAPPTPRLHAAFGQGFRYALGPDAEYPQADLEVYPDAKLIRYSSEGLAITMHGETIGAIYIDDTVVFDQTSDNEHRSLTVTRLGEVFLAGTTVPPMDDTARVLWEGKARVQKIADDSETVVNEADDLDPWNQPEPTESNTTDTQPNDPLSKTEKQTRLVLTGRAGRDPQLRETAKGTAIAKFPLATHEKEEGSDQETTNWYTIVCFNGLAREVAELVKKGETYKVVGYEHERMDRDKLVTEVYAATVKPPSKRPTGGTEERMGGSDSA